MTDDAVAGRRRRRRRRGRAGEVAAAGAPDAGAEAAPAAADAPTGKPVRRRRAQRETSERGLRDIVGAGQSQLGVSGALRARDANRPTPEDLAEAERDVVIIRRNWKPPAS